MPALTIGDRKRVNVALREWASSGSVVGMRNRALITLAQDTGLRLAELCALDVAQLTLPPFTAPVITSCFQLRAAQAKGRRSRWVDVPGRSRSALRSYLRAARAAGWIAGLDAPGPLFVTHRGRAGVRGHGRLSRRSAQHAWHEVQARARLRSRYNFHALRHDCADRLRAHADTFELAEQLGWTDIRTAVKYVQKPTRARRAELAELAAR